MRKLVVVLVVLAVLGAGADVVIRKAAEGQVADRTESAAGSRASASAHISSFPFVLRLVAAGSVPRIDVRADRPVAGSVALAWIDVDLHGVRLDKHRLLSDHKAEITKVSSGTLTVAIDGPALSQLAHTDVKVGGGQIEVTVAGHTVRATPVVDGKGGLGLQVESLPTVPIRLPSSSLIPCQATSVQVSGDVVELSCPFTEVPPALLRAATAAQQ